MNDPLGCPHFPACSGCASIGTPYAEQLDWKLHRVRAMFSEAGLPGFDVQSIRGVTPSPQTAAYRNRVRLAPAAGPAGAGNRRVHLGLFRSGTHEVVDIPGCPVQLPGINETVETIRDLIVRHDVSLYDEISRQGDLRYVSVRAGARTGEQLVGLVTRGEDFPAGRLLADDLMRHQPSVVGVAHNINPSPGNVIFGPATRILAGRDYLEEIVCGVRIRLGLESFFQVNTAVAESAYAAIVEHLALTPDDTLLDLYCGVGAIGIVAAGHVHQVIGVEQNGEAIRLSEASARANGLENVRFVAGLVEEQLASVATELRGGGLTEDQLVVAVNPPRKGLDSRVVDQFLSTRPSRIAYLSCAPPTLLRDLKRFTESGYRIAHVELFDMFPQTEQVETLVIIASESFPDRLPLRRARA